jgi:hypothetical protein
MVSYAALQHPFQRREASISTCLYNHNQQVAFKNILESGIRQPDSLPDQPVNGSSGGAVHASFSRGGNMEGIYQKIRQFFGPIGGKPRNTYLKSLF